MTTKPFFVATVDMFQINDNIYDVSDPYDIVVSPANDTVGYSASDITAIYEPTWGAVSWGALSMTVEPTENTGTLYLSDDGYTTKSTDAGGVVVYPPKISASFGIDRQVPLPPGDGAGSWGFGALEISDNDDVISSLLRSWNIDAQNVTISRGVKTFETLRGIWTSPALADLDTVFTGIAGTWTATDQGVTIPLRDVSYWLDRPIQSTQYGGVGAYDGTADMAGLPLPKLRGKAYNIAPVLIDPTNLIYQYNDAAGTVVALYERGATGASGIVFQANTTDLYTGTTTAGQYRTDNSRGLFQLGSPPVGQITVTATGQFPTAGNKTVLADIARYLLTEDAAVPAGFVDTSNFTTAATDYAYDGGIYIAPDSGITARQAVAYVLASYGAKLIAGRNGQAKSLALRAASLTATPTVSLGTHNTIAIRTANLPSSLSPPPFRIRAGYQRNYTIQTDISELAGDTHREFVAKPDRYATTINTIIQAAYRRPNDLPPFGGGLDAEADAQSVADDIADLWCAGRGLYNVTVPMEIGLTLDIGNTVLLTWPTAVLRLGQRGIIVQEQFRSQENITFQVLI